MNTCLKEVVYTTVPSRLNKGEEEGKEDRGGRSRIRGGEEEEEEEEKEEKEEEEE